jgi:hypothetical protein
MSSISKQAVGGALSRSEGKRSPRLLGEGVANDPTAAPRPSLSATDLITNSDNNPNFASICTKNGNKAEARAEAEGPRRVSAGRQLGLMASQMPWNRSRAMNCGSWAMRKRITGPSSRPGRSRTFVFRLSAECSPVELRAEGRDAFNLRWRESTD